MMNYELWTTRNKTVNEFKQYYKAEICASRNASDSNDAGNSEIEMYDS